MSSSPLSSDKLEAFGGVILWQTWWLW